jgi:hypothetical protein
MSATHLWPRWHDSKSKAANKANYEQFFGYGYDELCAAMRKIMVEVGCHWPKVENFRSKKCQDLRGLAVKTFKQKNPGLLSGGQARQSAIDTRPAIFDEDAGIALADLIAKLHQNDVAGTRRAVNAGVLRYQDSSSKTKPKSTLTPKDALPDTTSVKQQGNTQPRAKNLDDLTVPGPPLTGSLVQETITIIRTNSNTKTQFRTKITRKRKGESKAVSEVVSSPSLAKSSTPLTVCDSATEYEPNSTSSSVFTRTKTSQLSSPIKLISKRMALPPLMDSRQLPLPSFGQLSLPQPSRQGRPRTSYHPASVTWPTLHPRAEPAFSQQQSINQERLGQQHTGLAMSHLTSASASMLHPATSNPSFFAPATRLASRPITISEVQTSRPSLMPALPAKTT